MDILANFARQLRDVWNRSSNTYRAAFAAALLFVVATMGAVGWWASRPQYIPLAENLAPSEAAAVFDRLTTQNIPAKMSFAGSTILVPEGRWNDAKLAASDVLGESNEAVDDGSGSLFTDPDTRKSRLHREKEQFLARSIARLRSVASAEVHLAVPDLPPFTRERTEPKASVVIGTRRGGTLSPEQASSIAAMVAASVERLTVQNVTVTDLNGQTLYPNAQSLDGGWSRHYQFKQQLESDLSAKAETMLASSLGPGRAVVRVTTDVDFTDEQLEETRYDPDGVKSRETIDSTESKGTSPTAGGVAGAASNVGAAGSGGGDAGSSLTQEKITAEYKVGMTRNVKNQYGGDILRLSISALVDLPSAETGATSGTTMTEAEAEELIKKAVGFDQTRGDEITVKNSPLTGVETEVETLVDTLNRWEFYNNLVRNASLGLAAIVALVLGLLLIRKLQPVTTAAAADTDRSRSAVMDELSAQVRQNPEVVSQIVNAWLNTPSTVPMTASPPGPADVHAERRAA